MRRKLAEAAASGAAASPVLSERWSKQLAILAADPLALAVLAFASLAFLCFTPYFLALLIFYSGLVSAAAFLLLVLFLIGTAVSQAPAAPLRPLIQMTIDLPARLYVTVAFSVLFLASFTAFKINIPMIVPFYADPWIADLDRWLHGTDAWRLARSLPAATGIIVDIFYCRLWFGVALGGLLYASVADTNPEYRRMAWSALSIYLLLGIVAATALSSVGPVFYDHFYLGGRFHDLTAVLNADTHAEGQKLLSDYLYSAYLSKTVAIGTGISAMPSIHVAIAVLSAWYLTSKPILWAIIGWIFAAIILFGSVYTGWHYALDSYFSAIAATAIWFAFSRYYRLPIRNRRPRLAAETAGSTESRPSRNLPQAN